MKDHILEKKENLTLRLSYLILVSLLYYFLSLDLFSPGGGEFTRNRPWEMDILVSYASFGGVSPQRHASMRCKNDTHDQLQWKYILIHLC